MSKRGDSFKQLTKENDSAEIYNGETFRLACCDCHLVHDVEVYADELPDNSKLVIFIRRNNRLTRARRKLKKSV